MRFASLWGSPLAVVVVGVVVVALYSLAYGAGVSSADANAAARVAAVDQRTVIERVAGQQRMGPRLLRPPANDRLGLDIAIEDRDGRSMEALQRALKRAAEGTGQARIVFYGASHVASDLFTGYLRRELQSRFGDAGHGFIVPVHPWSSYRHLDIQLESDHRRWKTHRIRVSDTEIERVGLAGAAMEVRRPGSYGVVRTAERGDHGRRASLFELYYEKQPRGGDLEVRIDGRAARRIRTRAPKVEPGYATFRVADGPHRFEIRSLGRNPVRVYGLVVERDQPGVVVDTLGINGSRARYQLLWEDELYREHLRRRDPDLVVLAYGTNESGDESLIEEYEADLRRVVARVTETVPEASCLLIGPSDRPIQVEDRVFEDRVRTAQVIEVQHRVAFEYGCGFFDLVAFQGGALSTVQWAANDPPYAQQDHVHYTRLGYQRLGEALLAALLDGMPESVVTAEAASTERSSK